MFVTTFEFIGDNDSSTAGCDIGPESRLVAVVVLATSGSSVMCRSET